MQQPNKPSVPKKIKVPSKIEIKSFHCFVDKKTGELVLLDQEIYEEYSERFRDFVLDILNKRKSLYQEDFDIEDFDENLELENYLYYIYDRTPRLSKSFFEQIDKLSKKYNKTIVDYEIDKSLDEEDPVILNLHILKDEEEYQKELSDYNIKINKYQEDMEQFQIKLKEYKEFEKQRKINFLEKELKTLKESEWKLF